MRSASIAERSYKKVFAMSATVLSHHQLVQFSLHVYVGPKGVFGVMGFTKSMINHKVCYVTCRDRLCKLTVFKIVQSQLRRRLGNSVALIGWLFLPGIETCPL